MLFKSNKDRRKYWEHMISNYSQKEIQEAFATLKPDTARVLDLHYRSNYPLKEIGTYMNRSISVIRNHHNRGIFQLHRYFGEAGMQKNN